MPELPEVETVKRGLEPVTTGAQIIKVEQNRPDLRFPFPKNFVARLEGKTIGALSRRAKYLLLPLDSGEILVVHLGMSGRVIIGKPSDADGKKQTSRPSPAHDHVVMHLSSKAVIRYNDPRRFGFMTLVENHQLSTHKLFRELGPEPLGNAFHAQHLASMAKNRKAPLKSFLLDQKTVAGLGNIYVCEALFRAGLSPLQKALSLVRKDNTTKAAEQLTTAIREVLREAIEKGGSTLRDHRLTDGSLGYFQHCFAVYGRDGEACRRPECSGTIKRLTQAGRSTYFCPQCQKLHR
jgi:formamidopyrimidine-DNA glycosylase